MSEHVSWMLELEMQDGRQDDFKALMDEMVQSTQQEVGTLDYEWSVSADGKRCHLFERYADSGAVMTHLGAFGSKFAERFLEILKPVRFVVYGSPNAEVKAALAAFSPEYMESVGGFSR